MILMASLSAEYMRCPRDIHHTCAMLQALENVTPLVNRGRLSSFLFQSITIWAGGTGFGRMSRKLTMPCPNVSVGWFRFRDFGIELTKMKTCAGGNECNDFVLRWLHDKD